MDKKLLRWVMAVTTLMLAAAFLLFTAAPALAQDEAPRDELEQEIPEELKTKIQEFEEAASGLREDGALLKEDVRQFKAAMQELWRKARSLPRDEKWDFFDEVSAARKEYVGTVKDKISAARETAGAMRDALAAAREAWEQDDLDGALANLDEAIARAGELEAQLGEAHQLLQEILETVRALSEGAGAKSAAVPAWAS
ncbi:MAG: hypothetical protein JW854_00100 [Actinobacteria bacterium]|nr:hypothetical protein [Actinomycetota bacterium]